MPGYRIAPLHDVDPADILRLVRRCLADRGADAEAFWSWKHSANPFGASPGLVAVADGRPVGIRLFMRWKWQAGSRAHAAARAVDTAIDPEWRRQGLFTSLTSQLRDQLAASGVTFIYNTPNSSSGRGYSKLGWNRVGRVRILIRPQRLAPMLRALRSARDERPVEGLRIEGRPIASLLAEPELERILADSWAGDERLRTARTREYLDWRYAQAPTLNYRASWQFAGDSAAMLIYRARMRRGCRELILSEALATRSAPPGLLEELARNCIVENGADYAIATAAAGTPERRALRRAGFLPALPLGPALMVNHLTASTLRLESWSAWRLSLGDLEVF